MREAATSGAAVGPKAETFDVIVAGVISSARSPAATLSNLAAVEDVSGALAEELGSSAAGELAAGVEEATMP